MFEAPTWMATSTVCSSLRQKAPEREPRSFHLSGGARSGLDALPEPHGEFLFGQFASSQRQDDPRCICMIIRDRYPVDPQKDSSRDPSCPLVSVYEWMIARNSGRIGCRKRWRIGLSISGKIGRASQGRLQSSKVTKAGWPPMFR
jgi:hypothetical protein